MMKKWKSDEDYQKDSYYFWAIMGSLVLFALLFSFVCSI